MKNSRAKKCFFDNSIRHVDYFVHIRLPTLVRNHLLQSSVSPMTSITTGPRKVQEKHPEMLIFSFIMFLVV